MHYSICVSWKLRNTTLSAEVKQSYMQFNKFQRISFFINFYIACLVSWKIIQNNLLLKFKPYLFCYSQNKHARRVIGPIGKEETSVIEQKIANVSLWVQIMFRKTQMPAACEKWISVIHFFECMKCVNR